MSNADGPANIKLISTGGTIDKIYFDAKSAYQIGEPQIMDILSAFNVALKLELKPLMRKDSLELNDDDRQLIRNTIETDDCSHFLITHGTDTMTQTAGFLGGMSNKVIVLTGALNPARFIGSDAVFNVGCALGALQCLTPGVYIAMNGRIWKPGEVQKNVAANRFEAA